MSPRNFSQPNRLADGIDATLSRLAACGSNDQVRPSRSKAISSIISANPSTTKWPGCESDLPESAAE